MENVILENAGRPLFITNHDGSRAISPATAFVDVLPGFTSVLNLDNPFGSFWLDYTQVGAITLTVGGKSKVGGADRVKIAANGSAINLSSDYTWVNINNTAISTVNGTSNIIYAVKVGPTRIEYAVTVTTP